MLPQNFKAKIDDGSLADEIQKKLNKEVEADLETEGLTRDGQRLFKFD